MKVLSLLLLVFVWSCSIQPTDAFLDTIFSSIFASTVSVLTFTSDFLFDFGLTFPNPLIFVLPEQACSLRILLLDFRLGNFGRYNRYFRDNSKVTLAAAGEYQNAKNIEEYIKFGDSASNPYIDDAGSETLVNELAFLRYENGQCVFANNVITRYKFTDGLTKGGTIQVGLNTVVYFDYNERYFPRLDLYYSEPATAYIFDAVDTDNVRSFICSILSNDCQGIATAPTNCEAALADLPVSNNGGYVDGNSQGCRVLHGFLAQQSPAQHCPHISLEPLLDPDNKIKCQASSMQNIQVTDLFSQSEIQGFEAFWAANGLDPALGYKVEVGFTRT